MVSVVMATYNSRHYIEKQLETIINQTYSVDEVIICDDCSTDNTVEWIEKYIQSHRLKGWKIYRNPKNLGFIENFSRAMSLANGDIVILCDHDDEWLPDKVKLIKDTFKTNINILALNTSFIQIDENGVVIPTKNKMRRANNNLIRRKITYGSLNKMSFRDIAVYNISPGCTMAVRKRLVDEYLRYDNHLPHDWKLNILASIHNGLYYLDVPTTKYRIYSSNTIGLGHVLDYQKRVKLVENGLIEKREIRMILDQYGGQYDDKKYMDKILSVFEKRRELMISNKTLLLAAPLVLQAMKYTHLEESVIFDILSIIRRKRGN